MAFRLQTATPCCRPTLRSKSAVNPTVLHPAFIRISKSPFSDFLDAHRRHAEDLVLNRFR